jgi:TolB-like protein
VLPLLNASGDSNLEYLSDGITESLINSVSQSSQIKVMARNTAFRYKGSKLRAQEIGEALNVEAVLTGSITQTANKLIVKVELIDVEDSSQLWGESGERALRRSHQGLQRTLATVDNREALAMLGYAFAVAGREDEARCTLLRLQEEAFKGYVDPAFMAAVCIGLNENDEALDYLEQAYEHRSEWLALIYISPVFDRLHADARFQNLLRRIGHTN